MRLATVAVSLSLLFAGAPIAPAAAQGVGITVKLGPERTVRPYSSDKYGDWHTNYKKWTPTTLYYNDGHYYGKKGPGSRAVMVYKKGNDYFLPPHESDWVGKDKRYNYSRKPNDEDYNHRP
jgi:hypothetical protein